jgi:hypothetical protein
MNIALLSVKHGRELGWVCLGLCGLDVIPPPTFNELMLTFAKVIVNSFALFWITRGNFEGTSGGTGRHPNTTDRENGHDTTKVQSTVNMGINSPRKARFTEDYDYSHEGATKPIRMLSLPAGKNNQHMKSPSSGKFQFFNPSRTSEQDGIKVWSLFLCC